MTLWQYKAIPRAGGALRRGRLVAGAGADVRASLRRIGLQVVDLRPVKEVSGLPAGVLGEVWQRHVRNRRRPTRAELFDSLATMLEAGLPMLESVETLESCQTRISRSTRHLLLRLRSVLQGGGTLSQALDAERAWFDPVEVAMVEAGQQSGRLSTVLRTLADRHERTGQLGHKLTAALAYPFLVSLLGLGVVVFLSTETLPELVQILEDAGVEVPALTQHVLAVGGFIGTSWPALLAGSVVVTGLVLTIPRLGARSSSSGFECPRYVPPTVRRMRVGSVAAGLSELLQSGVPMVDALRVLAPTAGGPRLEVMLTQSANRLEAGSTLSEAFREGGWFDEEFLRLLDLGQSVGELPPLLERISLRYRRSAERTIDRLAALLEPGAVLVLAVLVGTVALAAILPLFQLQEIL